jgi:hypothetical protein
MIAAELTLPQIALRSVIDGVVGWHVNRVKLKCAAFAGA